jgi:hypothetical protein
MRLKIGILILILHGVYHLNAQETKQSYLDSVLLNDNFKEFIIENGIENVVDKLCDYYLASKPSNIWYSENLLDTNFATWSFVPAKMYVTTLRLKSIFWLYLVFSNTKK